MKEGHILISVMLAPYGSPTLQFQPIEGWFLHGQRWVKLARAWSGVQAVVERLSTVKPATHTLSVPTESSPRTRLFCGPFEFAKVLINI